MPNLAGIPPNLLPRDSQIETNRVGNAHSSAFWGIGTLIPTTKGKKEDLMTSLMELYHNGTIEYLVRTRVVSTTILSYIQYFEDFTELKMQGKTYRESVRLLSAQHQVSETTIKKGIRIVTAAQRQVVSPLGIAV